MFDKNNKSGSYPPTHCTVSVNYNRFTLRTIKSDFLSFQFHVNCKYNLKYNNWFDIFNFKTLFNTNIKNLIIVSTIATFSAQFQTLLSNVLINISHSFLSRT